MSHQRRFTPHFHLATAPLNVRDNEWCSDCREYLGPRYAMAADRTPEQPVSLRWLLWVFVAGAALILGTAYVIAHVLVLAGVACPGS